MAEAGCLKDKQFQNLQVEGKTNLGIGSVAIKTTTGTTGITGVGPTEVIFGKNGGSVVADPYTESATQLFALGTKLVYGNNVYRYGQLAASIVLAGKLVQHAAIVANHTNMTATAVTAVGATDISVETVGTNMTLNQYTDGYLWVNDHGGGTGEGQTLRIKSNPAHNHGDDPSVVITTYDPLVTALTTASQVAVLANPYSALVVAPTTEAGKIMGATVIDMTASYYGWFTVSGPQALLTQGVIVVGNIVVRAGGTTAGAVVPATDNLLTEIGECMAAHASPLSYQGPMRSLAARCRRRCSRSARTRRSRPTRRHRNRRENRRSSRPSPGRRRPQSAPLRCCR